MSEIGAPPAAAARASPSTGRMAPPSRKPRGLRPALSTGKLPRSARTDHGWGWFLGAHLSFTRAACYTPWPRDGDTILPRVTGLRSAPGVPLVGPGEWCQAPACAGGVSGPGRMGGVTPVKRRKGSNRAKVTRPWWRQGHPIRPCAWCAHPVHGDAVTVTFPDKAQAIFLVVCLYQYRAVMWPQAAP